jgi:hypothetical protein
LQACVSECEIVNVRGRAGARVCVCACVRARAYAISPPHAHPHARHVRDTPQAESGHHQPILVHLIGVVGVSVGVGVAFALVGIRGIHTRLHDQVGLATRHELAENLGEILRHLLERALNSLVLLVVKNFDELLDGRVSVVLVALAAGKSVALLREADVLVQSLLVHQAILGVLELLVGLRQLGVPAHEQRFVASAREQEQHISRRTVTMCNRTATTGQQRQDSNDRTATTGQQRQDSNDRTARAAHQQKNSHNVQQNSNDRTATTGQQRQDSNDRTANACPAHALLPHSPFLTNSAS